jgi:hypothetical protein
MINLRRPVKRQTDEQYKHYRRAIVVELYNDTLSLRLKGTRTKYEIPLTHLMDILCRRQAAIYQLEKARKAKERKAQKRRR